MIGYLRHSAKPKIKGNNEMTPAEAHALAHPIFVEKAARELKDQEQYRIERDHLEADRINDQLLADRETSLTIISAIDNIIRLFAGNGRMHVIYPLHDGDRLYTYNLDKLNAVNKMVIAEFKNRGFGVSLGTTTTYSELSGNCRDYGSGTMESTYYTDFKFYWGENEND
jgi:hypothetical protein